MILNCHMADKRLETYILFHFRQHPDQKTEVVQKKYQRNLSLKGFAKLRASSFINAKAISLTNLVQTIHDKTPRAKKAVISTIAFDFEPETAILLE